MKTRTILLLASIPLIGLALLAAVLVTANRAGENAQRPFFEAIATGDSSQVMALMAPSLHREVDEPALAAWMTAINQRLGKYEGIARLNFKTSCRYEKGVSTIRSVATVRFEKGSAQSEIVYADGKIVGFDVDSSALTPGWFKGPAKLTSYHEKAQKFFVDFAAGNAKNVQTQMHESLISNVSNGKLEKMFKGVKDLAGDIDSVDALDAIYDSDEESVQVILKVHGEKTDLDAVATYRFFGLKSQLIQFNMKPSKAIAAN